MGKDYVTVKISKNLYEEIEKKVGASQGEFRDAQEYIEFVLNLVKEEEKPETVYTQKEEEDIKKRLKQLGYL